MKTIILQSPSTFETRVIRSASMMGDPMKVLSASLEQLSGHSGHLQDGALPVGSVEFVRAAMVLAGIPEPKNITYPDAARPYLLRSVHQRRAGDVLGHCFIKPVATKAFTGFVFNTMTDPETLSRHDQEQHSAFLAMPSDDLVWVSDPVQWSSEWRYYVDDGVILGRARYDDGDEYADEPDLAQVHACVADLALDHPYVLDFGVLDSGETALVEVNDAWAIGLYGNALTPISYQSFLQNRWKQLFAEAHAATQGFKQREHMYQHPALKIVDAVIHDFDGNGISSVGANAALMAMAHHWESHLAEGHSSKILSDDIDSMKDLLENMRAEIMSRIGQVEVVVNVPRT